MSTETEATPTLAQRVADVHQLRQTLASLQEARAVALEAWERDNAALLTLTRETADRLREAEGDLRARAVETYQATGNTKPGPGLGIKLMTVLHYDSGDALAWAKEHRLALALDRATFERLAKTARPAFVAIETVPTGTIASDLGKHLEADHG